MAEGKTVITLNGLKALTEAFSLGRKTKPISFKVSDVDIGDIYPAIDIADLSSVWYQADISGRIPIDANTVQFVLGIPPDKAIRYGKIFGLYFEDGTLYAVAKPPHPFPPLIRQRLRVQFVWQQIESVMNFEDIPFYEFDQDIVKLEAVTTLSLAIFDIHEHLTLLDQFKADYFKNKPRWDKRLSDYQAKITVNELKLEDHELTLLEMMGSYGEQILNNSLQIGLLKQYIKYV